jgi:hypothetical protein
MIRKSGHRFSEKIMLKQKDRAEREDDSKKSHPALASAAAQQQARSHGTYTRYFYGEPI